MSGSSTKLPKLSDSHTRIRRLKIAFNVSVRYGCPLVIHGPPGSGRTSMTAVISYFCRSWLSSSRVAVVARVLASSPASMNIEYVLSTICFQVSEVIDALIYHDTVFAIRFPKIYPSYPRPVDLIIGDIQRQSAAEWFEITQWSKRRGYRKPSALFRTVPSLTRTTSPSPKWGPK